MPQITLKPIHIDVMVRINQDAHTLRCCFDNYVSLTTCGLDKNEPCLLKMLYQTIEFCNLFKFKAEADDNFDVAKLKISIYDWVENTVGKEENVGYHHFLLFPQCFQEAPFSGLLKVEIVLLH